MDALQYVNELTPSQIRQTQDDSHACWGAGNELEERIQRLQELLALAGPNRFRLSGLSDENGFVPVSMKRHDLLLNVAGQPKKTLGIGAVFTTEASRNKGLAKQLLEFALGEATKEGYELALLFSEISPEYYKRLSFVEVPAWRCHFDVASLPKAHPLDIHAATPNEAPKLLNWYEKSWPRDFTRLVRDDFRWNFFRKRMGSSTDLIFSDGNGEGGYLTLSMGKAGSLWIDELVTTRPLLDRAWATIAKLAREKKIDEVRGFIPPFLLPNVVSEIQRRDKAVPMLKELRPHALDGLVNEKAHFNGPDLF